MSLMAVLIVLWAVITVALIILLIYRSTLTMHEDDQLFLDEAESHMQAEQTELLQKMNQIQPMVRILAAGTILLALVIGGMWLYQGFMQNHL